MNLSDFIAIASLVVTIIETGVIIYWVRSERRIIKGSDIKSSPARNPTEFAWESIGKTIDDVAVLKAEMAVLKDRLAQTQSTTQHHYWILQLAIASIAAVVAILAFLGVKL